MARAGQVAIVTAGTSQRGPNEVAGKVYLRAHPDNTEPVFVGGADAEVSGTEGFALGPGDSPILVTVSNLQDLWFDAEVSGEKICWFLL